MRKRYSLYTITLGVFFILIGIGFSSIYFSVSQHRKDMIETAILEKTHLAETINETLTSPVWIYRLALVPGMERAFIEEMAKFKDVKYIRVVLADGTIYKSSIEEEWGKILRDPTISKVLNTGKPVVKDQIFKDEKVKLIVYPGYQDKTIWVAFSLKRIESEVRKMLIRDLLVMGGGMILIFLFLFFLLKGIVNPLREIIAVCEKIRRGDLKAKVKIKSKTEIGELADTFNQTIENLRKSKEELEEARASLEIRVKARTKELEELTKSLDEKVKQRTKELQDRINELERFHRLTIGRELKMIELEKEIKRLKEELKKYKSK